MPQRTINWMKNKFIKTYLQDNCVCINGEINVENLPNCKEEDVVWEAINYFKIYPFAKNINLMLNGENIKILPNYTINDVLKIYDIKREEHAKAEEIIQNRIKKYFNNEKQTTIAHQIQQNCLINPPVYFLYTNSSLLGGYSNLVDFPKDENNYNRIVSETISNIYNNSEDQSFYEFEKKNFRVICFCFKDCRKDQYGRGILSYLGVIIDKNDLNFNVEEFKNKIGKPKFSKGYSIFDLIKEKKLPIKYSSKLNMNLEGKYNN